MSGPPLVLDMMAAIVLVTSGYCFTRLVVARRWHRSMHYDVNLAHVAMGVAMAGMFVASFRSFPARVWEVGFSCLMAWFAFQVGRFVWRHGLFGWDADDAHHLSHYATHFVMALAMLYVFLSLGAPGPIAASQSVSIGVDAGSSGSMSGTAARPGLAFLLLVVLLASAVWHADGLARFSRAWRPQPAGARLAPAGDGRTGSCGAPPAAGNALRGGADQPPQPLAPVPATSRLAPRRRGRGGPVVLSCRDSSWLAPRLEIGCHIAMCITMAYMLVTMR